MSITQITSQISDLYEKIEKCKDGLAEMGNHTDDPNYETIVVKYENEIAAYEAKIYNLQDQLDYLADS